MEFIHNLTGAQGISIVFAVTVIAGSVTLFYSQTPKDRGPIHEVSDIVEGILEGLYLLPFAMLILVAVLLAIIVLMIAF